MTVGTQERLKVPRLDSSSPCGAGLPVCPITGKRRVRLGVVAYGLTSESRATTLGSPRSSRGGEAMLKGDRVVLRPVERATSS
jgi:hypothetical protein